MNRTDIELPDGTVIPDSNASAPTPPTDAASAIPARLQVALATSFAMLAAGAGYRLGDALNPGEPLLPGLARWAWPAAQFGLGGVVVFGLIWLLLWRRGHRA